MINKAFISFGLNPHLKALRLNVEPSQDVAYIKQSDKPFIAWNYYANKELFDYFWDNQREAYCVERGALPDTIFIDGGGFNVLSKSYQVQNWNRNLTTDETDATLDYIYRLMNDDASLEPQNAGRIRQGAFDKLVQRHEYRKVVFVPLQLNRDTVIKYFSDWVGSVTNFVKVVIELASAYPDILFLVKNHPLEVNFETSHHNLRRSDDIHYKDCLKYSDLVLTINSGVGLQAMAFNTPCVICGKAFYQFFGLNIKADSAVELDNIIKRIDTIPPVNYEKMLRFYNFLLHELYSFVKMIKPNPKLNRMQIKDIQELRLYNPKDKK